MLTTFALDRIFSIDTSHKKYVDNDVDFAEYFDDVIGVTLSVNIWSFWTAAIREEIRNMIKLAEENYNTVI